MLKTKLKIILGSVVGLGITILGFLFGHRTAHSGGLGGNDTSGTGIDSASLRSSVDTITEGQRTEQAKLAELNVAIANGAGFASVANGTAQDALATARKVRDAAKIRQNTDAD